MTTPQELITDALGRSASNRADVLLLGAELLRELARVLAELSILAAAKDPTVFGQIDAVSFVPDVNLGGWPRPTTVVTVYRIEATPTTVATPAIASGTEITVIPFHDRRLADGDPAVYRFGQAYRSAGNAVDPTGGQLLLFSAGLLSAPGSLTAPLDPRWPTAFNMLLILALARFLAAKDGRTDEASDHDAKYLEWLTVFSAFLEGQDLREVARFVPLRREELAPRRPAGAGGGG